MADKTEEARMLAQDQYELEPGILQIYRLSAGAEAENRPDEPIKLLEVNEATIPAGIMPLGFGPLPEQGLHYSIIIVSITPEEFAQLKANELKLPNNWTIGELLPKSVLSGVP